MLRGVAGGAAEVGGRPLVVRMQRCLTAEAGGAGLACVLYAGAIEELVGRFTGRRPRVLHDRCAARGDGWCEWRAGE